jgi:nitroreductase
MAIYPITEIPARMHVDQALLTRRSARAFRSDPVPRALVEEILRLASRAPSGTNIQPWKVHVVAGAEFPRTSKRKEPYVSRMRKLGKDMYGLLGVPKGDQGANWRQWGRNYQFFDAPVGLILTIDKDLDAMSYLDVGTFAMAIMLAAKARGLDTCAQGAWNNYWSVTRRVLGVPDDQYIICGISLGYADQDHPVNTLEAEREPLDSFATFHGW